VITGAFAADQQPPQQFLDALNEICAASKAKSIKVIIDAESQHFQKGISAATVDLMRRFNRDGFAVIYNTYQAYLKKTPAARRCCALGTRKPGRLHARIEVGARCAHTFG
jgi:hypothetical protein